MHHYKSPSQTQTHLQGALQQPQTPINLPSLDHRGAHPETFEGGSQHSLNYLEIQANVVGPSGQRGNSHSPKKKRYGAVGVERMKNQVREENHHQSGDHNAQIATTP